MNNNIDKFTKNSFEKLDSTIKNNLKDVNKFLYKELNKIKCVFYGKTALEISLNITPTFPFKVISTENIKVFLPIFNKILNIYKLNYKIDKLSKFIIYKLNLQNVLFVYYIDKNKYSSHIKNINNSLIFDPLMSLMDIYYMYSVPIMNTTNWIDLTDIDPLYIKTLKYSKNNNYYSDNILDNIYNKNFKLFTDFEFLKHNILLTGIHAYNEMMNTKYNDKIILMTYDVDNIINKIQIMYKNNLSVSKHRINFINYFNNYYIIKYKNIHLYTIFQMKDPFIYYHKTKRTNFHTTVFILLLNSIIEKTNKYNELINNLLIEGSKKDLLLDDKFKCFEVGYLNNSIKNLINQRKK